MESHIAAGEQKCIHVLTEISEDGNRRRLGLLTLGAALVLLIGLATLCLFVRHDPLLTKANCDRVSVGMPESEVEAILGSQGSTILLLGWRGDPSSYEKAWASKDDTLFVVSFNGQSRVRGKQLLRGQYREEGLLDRLRAWFHW